MTTSTLKGDVYCTFGLPEGRQLAERMDWLDQSEQRYLVVLSREQPLLPDHPRVRFGNLKDDESLKKIAWEFVFLEFDYEDAEACSPMAYFQQGVNLVASDFGEKGLDRLHHFFKNEPALKKARLAKDLFGAFSNTPAIICGAGPSLEREAPYLRTLKDRALIFGGGSALSALSELGIVPHFAGMIDPHEPSSRYFKNQNLDVPTFFQTRAHPTLVSQMEGPLLWAPGSENDLFDKEHFDGGWNASTFLASLACHLGCNPIILVGVDLAQTKDKAYAGNLERPEEGELIHVEGDLYTRRDWLFAADWLHEFTEKHPEVEWINGSEGLAIKGFEKKAIQDLSFEMQEDLSGRVHAAIQTARVGANTLPPEELKASFERVSDQCISMLQLLEKIFPTPPEKSGEYALLLAEIEKEMAYEHFLKPVWAIWKHVFEREIPKDVPKAYGIELNAWLFMKGICDEAREI